MPKCVSTKFQDSVINRNNYIWLSITCPGQTHNLCDFMVHDVTFLPSAMNISVFLYQTLKIHIWFYSNLHKMARQNGWIYHDMQIFAIVSSVLVKT